MLELILGSKAKIDKKIQPWEWLEEALENTSFEVRTQFDQWLCRIGRLPITGELVAVRWTGDWDFCRDQEEFIPIEYHLTKTMHGWDYMVIRLAGVEPLIGIRWTNRRAPEQVNLEKIPNELLTAMMQREEHLESVAVSG
jgi:hypothetical protein